MRDEPPVRVDDRRVERAIGLDHREPVLHCPEDQVGVVLVSDPRESHDGTATSARRVPSRVRGIEGVANDCREPAERGIAHERVFARVAGAAEFSGERDGLDRRAVRRP